MAELGDGESLEMKGSGARPYVLKNVGGVYSCSCPAWRNQSTAIERRTCKHLRKLRGDAAEAARVGTAAEDGSAGAGTATASGSQRDEATAKSGPPLLLAERWDNAEDLSGWWLSEKLDGVRAYWDGTGLISRLGNRFHAPDWFLEGLPDALLDGELWIGRKSFQRTVGIVRRQDKSDLWKEVVFVAFDAPGLDAPFEERQAFLREHAAQRRPPYLRAHEQQLCTGLTHLRDELARVEALGGEGLMIRQPGSRYEIGRSTTLLKVKSFRDAEARVVEHLKGAGRHKGRLGALLVELADGTRFSVGTGFSDAERAAPPAVGSVITFRYQELSDGGVPRFPSYIRRRSDGGGLEIAAATRTNGDGDAATVTTVTTATTATMTMGPSGQARRFELSDGSAAKFWEVEQAGTTVTVRFGRLGSAGQAKTKDLGTEEAARRHADGLIQEKLGKGYEEKSGE